MGYGLQTTCARAFQSGVTLRDSPALFAESGLSTCETARAAHLLGSQPSADVPSQHNLCLRSAELTLLAAALPAPRGQGHRRALH